MVKTEFSERSTLQSRLPNLQLLLLCEVEIGGTRQEWEEADSNHAIFDDEGNLRESLDRIPREVEDVGKESKWSEGRQAEEEVRKEGTRELACLVRNEESERDSDQGIYLFLIDDAVNRDDNELEGVGRNT